MSACFITFFAAVLNPSNGQIVYCNAGHNAPLIRQSGKVEQLGATGIPLGISRDAAYDQKRCHVEKEDILILFSDGVTEAHGLDADREFGEERLVSIVQSGRRLSVDGIMQRVKEELLSFLQGVPAPDDIRS